MVASALKIPASVAQERSIVLVHDWCPSWRGGERVLSSLVKFSQTRDVFTLFDFLGEDIKAKYFTDVVFHTSPVNRLPYIERYYRALFFACPFLIEQFDVMEFDAVISSSAAFARGVLTRPDQPHLCYVHSPARYAWDEQFSYLAQGKLSWGPKALMYRRMLYKLRQWDARTAHGPDLMVANSSYVAARIRRIYGRDASVVHPPVAIDAFPLVEKREDYYVTASFLAPYKRTDLVIEAFRRMPHRKLIVVGEGQQAKSLKSLGADNILFTGYLTQAAYVETISHARALVFAGCEDFGIALAEAQASGTPLIAFGRGGAVDIVKTGADGEDVTGLLFRRQEIDDVVAAVEGFESRPDSISAEACRRNAVRFSETRFQGEIAQAFDTAKRLNRARFG
ncbi:MAG: glycosyltransferase [Hyphomicrobiaceae bacterium]